MVSFSTLTLAFGVWVIVYALMFLGGLPLIAHRHSAGENVAPFIWRMSLRCLGASVLLVFLGFWLYERAI